jgi:hypothetical protein
MTDHIFKTPSPIVSNRFYCLSGQEDFIDDEGNPRIEQEEDPRVSAKATQTKRPKHFKDTSNYYRYYIKMNPNLEIYNPIQIYSSIKDKSKFAHINSVCKSIWTFKEVDISIFTKYITFLNTKNIQSLKDIERQIK